MLDPIAVTRVVSAEAVLNSADFPSSATVLRTAPDEAMLLNVSMTEVAVDDDHAIVVDDTGWKSVWLAAEQAERFMANNSSWGLPARRPAFAQGMIADTAVKLWVEADGVLFVVPHVAAHDFATRLAADGVTP